MGEKDVGSDYSGHPVARPTPEEAEASYRNNEPWPRADQAMELEDGTIAVEGDDGRLVSGGAGRLPGPESPGTRMMRLPAGEQQT